MKKIIIFTLLGLVLIAVGVYAISYLTNPLKRSEERIRYDILALTPIGSSIEDVIGTIENNESWEWSGHINRYHGFPADANNNVRVGEQSIRVTIGRYQGINRFPYVTHVVVFWGFDESSKLIDIRVWKST